MTMDVFPKPVQQTCRMSLADAFVKAGHLFFGGSEELSRVKTAQAIGGEIPKAAVAPVYVLETASFVVGNGHAQPDLVILVPPVGNIGYGEASLDQLFFQFVADH